MSEDKKDTIKELLNDSISEIIIRLKKVENFTLEHAPDVCKEIIAQKILQEKHQGIINLLIVGLMIVLIAGFTIAMTAIAAQWAYITFGIGIAIAGIACMVGGFESLTNFLNMKEIEVAPKLEILRSLRRLIR